MLECCFGESMAVTMFFLLCKPMGRQPSFHAVHSEMIVDV